jgi:hypothetical protein
MPASAVDLGRLVGATTPRIATRRPAGRSRGLEVVRWCADVLELELLPWQAWCLRAGLVRARNRWASRTVGILVARQNGKTRLTTVRALAGMVLFGERDVLAAAQNRDVALDAWRDALELAEEAGLDVHSVCRTNGRECFWIGDARYKVVSSTRRGGRGLSADLVILDELREYRDFDAWSALEKTRRARASSQVWAISNEGDEGSVALDALARAGRAAAAAGTPTDAAWLEYSAAPGTSRYDPAGWVASNPALGYLIEPSTLASEAEHDDPTVFETEVLCRRVASLRPWLPLGAWEACADPAAGVPDNADVVFALDADAELRHATIAVGYRRPDGRTHLEAVATFDAGDGPVLARAGVRLAELARDWQPAAVAFLARSHSAATALRELAELGTPTVAVGPADLAGAANAFLEAVAARTVTHIGDPVTASHLAAVTADGVMRARSPAAHVDGAVALVLARYAVGATVDRTPAQDWVAF